MVTRAESWLAASQSQAFACAASPPSWSLMHLHDQKPWEGGSLQNPARSHRHQSHPLQDYSQRTTQLDWQGKKALGQVPHLNPCTPLALSPLRWEGIGTYLKVRPSKMGVNGSLKVWHRVMAESKSPARTSRDTVSSGVELPEEEEEQVKPPQVTPQRSPGLCPVLFIEMQQQGANSLQHPAAVLLNPWLDFPGLQSIPGAQELSLKGLDRAAVTHRAAPDGAPAGEGLERDKGSNT